MRIWLGTGHLLLPVSDLGSVTGYPSGNLPQVPMMQTADERHLDHLPTLRGLHRPWDWTIMLQGSMRADFEVILEVGLENLPQLAFMEDNHSVQAFPPDRSNQPLDIGALPRRSWGDQLLRDAQAFDSLYEG